MFNMENSTVAEAVQKPQILEEIENTLQILYPNISKNIIANTLISKGAQMLTAKRIAFDETGEKKIPNWFALIFLKSGGGKDRLVNDIEKFVFPDFQLWFTEKSTKMYKLAQESCATQTSPTETENKTEQKGENNGNTVTTTDYAPF